MLKAILLSLVLSITGNASDVYFPKEFLFGVATAPAHVEDRLDDIWIDWAKQGNVRAFSNEIGAEDRNKFWTDYKSEIDLAHELGISVFRLGIDWGRFYGSTTSLDLNPDFLHYQKIIKYIKEKKMKVMLTLFHHSFPKNGQAQGGWANSQSINEFNRWSVDVVNLVKDDIDYLITFNEPNIYNMMTYGTGAWPNFGFKQGNWAFLNLGFYKGNYVLATQNMIESHKYIYLRVKQMAPRIQVGIAQHFAYFLKYNDQKNWITDYLYSYFNLHFLDQIKNQMDFVGVNYYGAEYFNFLGGVIRKDKEYSEAGRAIYPAGLNDVLKSNWERFQRPQFITENGIADSTDWIRPSYLLEHLSVVSHAIDSQIPIIGYIFWTLSDNWEWSDGYCPKFGLASVDRNRGWKRTLRPSFQIYRQIVSERKISEADRKQFWDLYISKKSQSRPFCRHEDGIHGLDQPVQRALFGNDWSFKTQDQF